MNQTNGWLVDLYEADANCLKKVKPTINSDAQQLNLLVYLDDQQAVGVVAKQTGLAELIIAAVDVTWINPQYSRGCRHTTG